MLSIGHCGLIAMLVSYCRSVVMGVAVDMLLWVSHFNEFTEEKFSRQAGQRAGT